MSNDLHLGGACAGYHDLVVDFGGPKPTIVVLCGSTRFSEAYRQANLRETLAGKIVLSIGCDTRSDADLAVAGDLGGDLAKVKVLLNELHRRKIDLADEVLVVSDSSGYFGESTRAEIDYTREMGKPVRYLVDEMVP